MVNNAYPNLPVLDYKKTTVSMTEVVTYLKSLSIPTEIKRSTHIFFKMESANGTKGINNNYVGCQLDGSLWPESVSNLFVGSVVLSENMTHKQRRFAAFKDFKGSVDFLAGRLQARGLYVGGYAKKIAKFQINTPPDLAKAYWIEWVCGDPHAKIDQAHLVNFLSMYSQAKAIFQ